MNPSEYHSNTEYADDTGNPVPATATPVSEATLRKYWDIRDEVN